MSSENDQLNSDYRDQLVTIGKAAASLIPLVGGVLGELLGHVVPQQRADRIAAYVADVEQRVAALELSLEDIFANPEKVDLIEEGAFQAARATTDYRIERIAALVADGLRSEDADIVRRKRLAALLGEIDDDELLVLNAYGQSYGDDADEAWALIDRPEPTHTESTISEVDAEKLYEAGRARLLRLDLLEKRYRRPSRGEQPKFDPRKGDFEHSIEISYLGRMLLRAVGQPTPYDMQISGEENGPS